MVTNHDHIEHHKERKRFNDAKTVTEERGQGSNGEQEKKYVKKWHPNRPGGDESAEEGIRRRKKRMWTNDLHRFEQDVHSRLRFAVTDTFIEYCKAWEEF